MSFSSVLEILQLPYSNFLQIEYLKLLLLMCNFYTQSPFNEMLIVGLYTLILDVPITVKYRRVFPRILGWLRLEGPSGNGSAHCPEQSHIAQGRVQFGSGCLQGWDPWTSLGSLLHILATITVNYVFFLMPKWDCLCFRCRNFTGTILVPVNAVCHCSRL